jgi:hypothetical protein
MKKFLFVGLVSLIVGCGSDDDKPGTQCCAVQKYCNACAYCKSDERSIGNSGDETACKQINDGFISRGRYCSDSDQTTRTTEFIAACASN